MARTVMMMLFLATTAAFADCDLSSARLGNDILKVGDSERRVLQHEPDRSVQVQNRFGAAAGIRYDFYLRGKTIQIYVRRGRIERVCHLRD